MKHMQEKKLDNATIVFDRLVDVSNASNLEELADYLDIKYGTLRGKKARGSIPYEEIVEKCSSEELSYVLKGNKIDAKVNTVEKPKIPYYRSVRPSAGGGIIPEDETDLVYIGLPRNFIYKEPYSKPNDLFVMRVVGDSMEPTINSQDFIIVNKKAEARPFAGRIYLIRLEESLLCKRLHELPERKLRVISDNPLYDDIDIAAQKEQFEVIGRVVWFARGI